MESESCGIKGPTAYGQGGDSGGDGDGKKGKGSLWDATRTLFESKRRERERGKLKELNDSLLEKINTKKNKIETGYPWLKDISEGCCGEELTLIEEWLQGGSGDPVEAALAREQRLATLNFHTDLRWESTDMYRQYQAELRVLDISAQSSKVIGATSEGLEKILKKYGDDVDARTLSQEERWLDLAGSHKDSRDLCRRSIQGNRDPALPPYSPRDGGDNPSGDAQSSTQ